MTPNDCEIDTRIPSIPVCTKHGQLAKGCDGRTEEERLREHVINEFSDHLREIRHVFTPAIRRLLLESMSLERCNNEWTENHELWCTTHEMLAKHTMDNGDDPCCEIYAKNEGCCCCVENRV